MSTVDKKNKKKGINTHDKRAQSALQSSQYLRAFRARQEYVLFRTRRGNRRREENARARVFVLKVRSEC